MANRLSTITTRTGDDGSTGLGDGSRTRKSSLRIRALGDVDELNSHLGVLLAELTPSELREELIDIQHDLFDLGAELCMPGARTFPVERVAALEACVARHNERLPRLAEFILPGGTRAAALAHVGRAVARRAERSLVELGEHDEVGEAARRYCNRLSDLLFVMARTLNRERGGTEPQWQPGRTHRAAS